VQRSRVRTTLTYALAVAGFVAVAGCGSKQAARTTDTSTGAATTTTATHPVSPEPTSLVVYRLHGGKLVPERVDVPRTTGVAVAALGALDLAAQVTVTDGTAHVDRPQSTPGQIAEIVYTLTRFPTIRRVDVGGRTALTRADVAEFVAPIMVDNPVTGDRFDGNVSGTASVYEATLVVELHQNGKLLAKRTVTASEGAPERGTFATRLDTSRGTSGAAASVVAYSPSAADGSEQHRVEVPVTLR
jgi:hypothetical protein